MSRARIIEALSIPLDALVERRVPKTLLLEQGAPTAADKRKIQEGIEELTWIAALKPTNIAVPAFQDDSREYLEVSVLTLLLRPAAKLPRLVELVHRAIPYPLVLVTEVGSEVHLSLAHKRWSQGESGKVVVDDLRQVSLEPAALTAADERFLESLAISGLPSQDLFALYNGLFGRLAALEAARMTGSFRPPETPEQGQALRQSLDRREHLQREIASLRARAKKEKQLNRRVELNLVMKRLEAELSAIQADLAETPR